jgi:uncharacterized protein
MGMVRSITNSAFILWRRLDRPGNEAARLTAGREGPVLEGTAVFLESGEPCRLTYRIVCDAAWRTVSAGIVGWHGERSLSIDVARDPGGNWTLNGSPCPDLTGCDDVDLSFTPSTNTLAIRRLALPVGSRAAVRAAWLRFPQVALELLDQSYERVADRAYRYESRGGSFMATLKVNDAGLVIDYPELWVEERSH